VIKALADLGFGDFRDVRTRVSLGLRTVRSILELFSWVLEPLAR